MGDPESYQLLTFEEQQKAICPFSISFLIPTRTEGGRTGVAVPCYMAVRNKSTRKVT